MKTDSHDTRVSESGVTLLEILLSVGVLGILLLAIVQFFQDIARRDLSKSVGSYMNLVQDDAESLVDDIDKFEALYTLVDGRPNDVLEIPINSGDLATTDGSAGVSLVEGGAGIPGGAKVLSGFRDTLPAFYGGKVTILVRAQEQGGERALVIMTATLNRIEETFLRQFAESLGPRGGYVSALVPSDDSFCDSTASCETKIRSAFGLWADDVAAFDDTGVGTRWANTVTDPTTPPNLVEGGYLVTYSFINETDIAGDYLFRTANPNAPELNRMNAALDLGGNNIVGVDNIMVANDLNVSEELHAQGSVFAGELSVVGDLQVQRDAFVQSLTVNPSYPDNVLLNTANVVRGDVVVEDQFNVVGAYDVSANVEAQTALLESLQAPGVRANTADISGLTVDTNGTAGVFAVDIPDAAAIQNETVLRAGRLNAGTLDLGGRNLGVISLDNRNAGLSVAGAVTNGNGANVPRVSISQGGGDTNINLLTQCQQGC